MSLGLWNKSLTQIELSCAFLEREASANEILRMTHVVLILGRRFEAAPASGVDRRRFRCRFQDYLLRGEGVCHDSSVDELRQAVRLLLCFLRAFTREDHTKSDQSHSENRRPGSLQTFTLQCSFNNFHPLPFPVQMMLKYTSPGSSAL